MGLRIDKFSDAFLDFEQIVDILKEKFIGKIKKIDLKFSFLEPDIKLSKTMMKDFKSDLKLRFPNRNQSELKKIIEFSYTSFKSSNIKKDVLLNECIW